MDINERRNIIGVMSLVCILVGMIAFMSGYTSGISDGAKMVHTGHYVVTELPDGSLAVTRPKK